MEIIRNNIHMDRNKVNETRQITVDDDFNIPDIKPDIIKVMQEKAEIRINEIRALKDHIVISGNMKFSILYISDGSARNIQSLTGEIPIEETINADGAQEGDVITLNDSIDDLNIRIINSRKINVRSLVTLNSVIEELYDEEAAVSVDEESGIECLRSSIECMQMYALRKDTYRIKEEIILPSNKANIFEIVWNDTGLRGLETKLMTDSIAVKGEVAVFLLYSSDDEENSMQWYETMVPFNGTLDCNGCNEEMIPDISVRVLNSDLEVKADFDGEDRVITLDMVLELNIKVYIEEKTDILSDAYCVNRNLDLVAKDIKLNTLLAKNNAKCKQQEVFSIPQENERILQICSGEAKVYTDKTEIIDNGVEISGKIVFQVLYVTSDDKVMFNTINDKMMFKQFVEVQGVDNECVITSVPQLEQLTITVVDSEKVDVKASVNLDLMILKPIMLQIISKIEEGEEDFEKLQCIPGITGYITKKGDTLWKIAKENYTTVENIKEINELKTDIDTMLGSGEKLILLKNVIG